MTEAAPVPAASVPASAGPAAVQPPAGARLGTWALTLALIVVLWPTLTGIGVILSLSETMPDVVRVIAFVMFFIGWLLVPLAFALSVTFAILAIRRNRRLGRVLAVIAVVILALVLVSLLVLGSFGFLGDGFLGGGIGM